MKALEYLKIQDSLYNFRWVLILVLFYCLAIAKLVNHPTTKDGWALNLTTRANSVRFLHRIEKQVSLFMRGQKFNFQCQLPTTSILNDLTHKKYNY